MVAVERLAALLDAKKTKLHFSTNYQNTSGLKLIPKGNILVIKGVAVVVPSLASPPSPVPADDPPSNPLLPPVGRCRSRENLYLIFKYLSLCLIYL